MSHNSMELADADYSGGGGSQASESLSVDGQPMSDSLSDGDLYSASKSKYKIFVGGLTPETTAIDLREYFQQFGTVTHAHVVVDQITQMSRRFGFVRFREASSVAKALGVRLHVVDGRNVDVNNTSKLLYANTGTKMFVGGLGQETSLNEFKAFFSQYGKILAARLPAAYPGTNKRHRGYGVITFESADVVRRLCEVRYFTLEGNRMDCKIFHSNEPQNPPETALPFQFTQIQHQQMSLIGYCYQNVPFFTPYPAAVGPPVAPNNCTQWFAHMSSFQVVNWSSMNFK